MFTKRGSLLQPAGSGILLAVGFLRVPSVSPVPFHNTVSQRLPVLGLRNKERIRESEGASFPPSTGNGTCMSKDPPNRNWAGFHKTRDLSTVWGMYYCHRAHAVKKHKETSFISLPETLLEPSGSAHSKSRIKTFSQHNCKLKIGT